jgi:hypothetical protein
MDVTERAEALATHMATQLRVRGDGLADISAKAGRRLPKRFRKDVQVIIEAEAMMQHPRLARLVDISAVRRAEKRLRAYLDLQDPHTVRRGEVLDVIAKVAFVLVTVVLAVFFFWVWRGTFD